MEVSSENRERSLSFFIDELIQLAQPPPSILLATVVVMCLLARNWKWVPNGSEARRPEMFFTTSFRIASVEILGRAEPKHKLRWSTIQWLFAMYLAGSNAEGSEVTRWYKEARRTITPHDSNVIIAVIQSGKAPNGVFFKRFFRAVKYAAWNTSSFQSTGLHQTESTKQPACGDSQGGMEQVIAQIAYLEVPGPLGARVS